MYVSIWYNYNNLLLIIIDNWFVFMEKYKNELKKYLIILNKFYGVACFLFLL